MPHPPYILINIQVEKTIITLLTRKDIIVGEIDRNTPSFLQFTGQQQNSVRQIYIPGIILLFLHIIFMSMNRTFWHLVSIYPKRQEFVRNPKLFIVMGYVFNTLYSISVMYKYAQIQPVHFIISIFSYATLH